MGKTQVLLLRTWTTNIGNGFIDKGARSIIEKALPDCEIIETSGLSNLARRKKARGQLAGISNVLPSSTDKLAYLTDSKLLSKKEESAEKPTPLSVAELTDPDIAVLPGCVLYRHGIGAYMDTITHLKDRGIPLVLLGAGGGDYNPSTVQYVKETLDRIDPELLITRDSVAFDHYEDHAKISHDGIDCAFFIDEWYDPPEATEEIIASTFDKTKEPNIKTGRRIIRPHHAPYEEPYHGEARRIQAAKEMSEFLERDGAFISDLLEDYLFIYSNADKTLSDRIHACVPALVYGNKARFYYETPRSYLFDRVLEDDLRDGFVSLDRESLNDKKAEQVSVFKSWLDEAGLN